MRPPARKLHPRTDFALTFLALFTVAYIASFLLFFFDHLTAFFIAQAVLAIFLFLFFADILISRSRDYRRRDSQTDKREFLALSLHRLRTPLTGIYWASKMLASGEMGPLNEEQRTYLEQCKAEAEKALGYVQDMLTIDKVQSAARYTFVPVQIGRIVKDVIADISHTSHKEYIRVVLVNPEEADMMGTVLADEKKIRAVIENILDNAVKYSIAGSTVSVEFDQDERSVLIAVKDAGIGIPRSEYQHIFKRFFRGSNVRPAHKEGTGIGLYLSKHIIDRHGGKIWFESEEGKGTTFFIRIPKSATIK